MTSNSSSNNQRQLPTNTADAIAPTVAASNEAADLGFEAALDALREGIGGYGDRISASAAVLRAVDDLAVPASLLSHPRLEQAIWRYDHAPDTVRREIEVTIDRETDGDVTVSEVVATYRVAAARLDTPIQTD